MNNNNATGADAMTVTYRAPFKMIRLSYTADLTGAECVSMGFNDADTEDAAVEAAFAAEGSDFDFDGARFVSELS